MKKLRDKIFDDNHPVIFYELLPPDSNQEANMEAYIDCSIDLLTSTPIIIDAVNIPEIRDEDHNSTKRTKMFVPKMDSGIFAKMLEQASYKHIEVILNRCTVFAPLEEQKRWFESAIKQHNLRALILVGGSSRNTKYPGPSVLEMGDYLKAKYPDELIFGGIAIPTRRFRDQEFDEPFRLFTKGMHGLDFFTTQIIFEPISIKLLLRDYAHVCQEKGVKPKRIFLSFAPISCKKDLEFLRWLGVVVNANVEQELFKAEIGIGWRSIKIALNVLQDILNFMSKEHIKVPIGLNIEHIARHNFELSLEFIQHLGQIYYYYTEGSAKNGIF